MAVTSIYSIKGSSPCLLAVQVSAPVLAILSAKKGAHCSRLGASVNTLTTTRQMRETINAGMIASRSDKAGGRNFAPRSQKTVTKVPAAIELTAPAALARFQKNAAMTTGVIAAE